ncbi:MAG: hypothetical protein ABJH08_09675 [Balneola sp.]
MNYVKISLMILFISSLLLSCSKTATDSFEEISLTEDQLEMKSKMKQTSLILLDLVTEKDVIQELKIATSYALEQERDEDVTFSELMHDNSDYKMNTKYKNSNVLGSFKSHFKTLINTKSKINGSTIDPDLESYLIQNNLKIYWPYSENWDSDVVPTISYHPLDNEDTNEGFKPVRAKSSGFGYENITMNDDYAYNNPSLLIVPCEENMMVYKTNLNEAISCGGGGGPSNPGGGSGNDDTNPGEYDINQVILHSARLSEQYDGLFAGGSEVFWQLTDAVKLTTYDSQPEVRYGQSRKNFSRRDIRKKYWKNLSTTVDDDWADYELAKELYIWEGDEGDVKVDFSLGVNVKISESVSANFNVSAKVDKKRDDLYKGFMDRNVFYTLNRTDIGLGRRDGFQVRHSSNLKWVYKENGVNTTSN